MLRLTGSRVGAGEPRLTGSFTGIVEIGSIRTDFTKVDRSKFQQRLVGLSIEYRLHYQVVIEFGSNEGVLNCFCVADGKRIGDTTISFGELTR